MTGLWWFLGGILFTILLALYLMGGGFKGMFAFIVVLLAPRRWWG